MKIPVKVVTGDNQASGGLADAKMLSRYVSEILRVPDEGVASAGVLPISQAEYDKVMISPLFAAGEQGVWYDPSDLSTMFQDSAGTTPVTAVEQPVGLLLDKSKGLVLGSELVTNGTGLVSTTGWTPVQTAVLSAVGGALRITSSTPYDQARQTITTVVGKSYRVSFTVGAIPNNQVYADAASVSSGLKTTAGTYSFIFRAVSTSTTLSLIFTGTGNVDFSNISVREIAGNHASQSTSASRPTLSARYNLLTYSEQFDNAAWTKGGLQAFGSGSTANAITAPDGTNSAETITENSVNTFHRVFAQPATALLAANNKYALSCYLKNPNSNGARYAYMAVYEGIAGAGLFCASYDLVDGVVTSSGKAAVAGAVDSASITSVGNGWYRCVLNVTVGAAGTSGAVIIGINRTNASVSTGSEPSYVGDGTSGLYLWGAQLIVTNDLTSNAYQRIAAATDYDSDATKFPKYLRFDGSDDSLATSSIDFSGTDKMTVFAGVRKLSDAAGALVLELSANMNNNAGSFYLSAPDDASTNRYATISRGSATATTPQASYVTGTGVAPDTAVLTCLHNISGDSSIIRRNGTAFAAGTDDKGTGNFGNYPLFIGSRNQASVRFTGRIYSLIVRGAATADSLITSTEKYVAGKTGVTL